MAEPDRLQGLVEAGIALSSELSIGDLLQKLVETAAGLTGARYAALGVIDDTGTEARALPHDGGRPGDACARSGSCRAGGGFSVAPIPERGAAAAGSRSADDPRSVGFPPNHPRMHGFLGVPILLRGRAYGNLGIPTEKAEGPVHRRRPGAGRDAGQPGGGGDRECTSLRGGDESVGAAGGVERGRNGAGRRDRAPPTAAVDLPGTFRGLIRARVVTIALPASDGTLRIEAADGQGADELLGCSARACRLQERPGTRAPARGERVDSLADDSEVDHEADAPTRCSQAGLYVPLIARWSGDWRHRRPRQGRRRPALPATSTSASRRPLPFAPPLPSTFRHGWRATPCGE